MSKRLIIATVLLSAISLAGFTGCGGQSFDYHSDNEIPEGPGLFSKEKGEFTVYSSDSGQADGSVATTESAPTTTETAPAAEAAASERADFEAFQQWKKEQSEFEAFQEWKRSKQGAKAYEEFLEWQRWREYRQWQEQQKKNE